VLVRVEAPLGDDFAPSLQALERARREDLNRAMSYRVAFMPFGDRVIFDRACVSLSLTRRRRRRRGRIRCAATSGGELTAAPTRALRRRPENRYNTAAMLRQYYGPDSDFSSRIRWSPGDPNVLELDVPRGPAVRTRVTRRSEEFPEPSRIETSEFVEQARARGRAQRAGAAQPPLPPPPPLLLPRRGAARAGRRRLTLSRRPPPPPQVFEDPDAGSPTRVKASQCFTKYKFRAASDAAATGGGPLIVATQVVSDYLTAGDAATSVERLAAAGGRPVAQFTYRLAFQRPAAGAAAAGAPAAVGAAAAGGE
jgi:hypothetical protein